MSGRKQHHDESVRLLDLVAPDFRMSMWIDGHDFVDCELVGPAVLLVTRDRVEFTGNSMSIGQFWPIEPGRSYEGAIGLRDCAFKGCTFRDVGIAADVELLRDFGV